MLSYLRTCPILSLTYKLPIFPKSFNFLQSSKLCCTQALSISPTEKLLEQNSPFAGVEDVMMGYIFGKNKSTEVAHSLWNHIIKDGDTVVDATCGNGYDTLAMLRMVADSTLRGRVYAMDVQQVALEKTSALLDQHVTAKEKELVELFAMCHSNLEDVVPHGIPVRLVAFNLGYLPGGNKKVMTRSETTRPALEAAKRILAPGGLISIMVYVGHAGGREEFETVQAFASGLHVENWSCCKLEMLNRPEKLETMQAFAVRDLEYQLRMVLLQNLKY